MSNISETDFWWIREEQHRSLYVGVGHHRPLTDDDNPYMIEEKNYYPLGFIHQWRRVCNDINVHRTLTLFDKGGEAILLGPFLIDIDNSQWTDGYQEDLEDALQVAQSTIRLLKTEFAIHENDLRVLFTGRKGFNIEVRPSSLGIRMDGTVDAQVKVSRRKLEKIRDAVRSSRGTTIDRIYGGKFDKCELKHPYVRLHNSINEWMQKDGNKLARRKIKLSLADLFGMSAEQICQQARCAVSTPHPSEP